MSDFRPEDAHSETLSAGIHHRTANGRPFVVLSGRATVEFDEGDALIYLRRGSMCTLPPMVPTRWTVAEPTELLPVSEAAVVFKENDGSRALARPHDGQADRPFRPRRHVS